MPRISSAAALEPAYQQQEELDAIVREWVQTWGETVTITRATQMLGRSRWTVRRWLDEGFIREARTGMVVVRSAAIFMLGGDTTHKRMDTHARAMASPKGKSKSKRASLSLCPRFDPDALDRSRGNDPS